MATSLNVLLLLSKEYAKRNVWILHDFSIFKKGAVHYTGQLFVLFILGKQLEEIFKSHYRNAKRFNLSRRFKELKKIFRIFQNIILSI